MTDDMSSRGAQRRGTPFEMARSPRKRSLAALGMTQHRRTPIRGATVPEGASGVERNLHVPPSAIGRVAADPRVKRLVLTRRMLRALRKEDRTRTEMRKRYTGPLEFANDLDGFPVP